MTKRSKNLRLMVLVGLWSVLFCSESWAAVEAMESSVLRAEVTASPYSFRIVERSTGEVLLSESTTAFTNRRYRATEATDITKAPDTLGATLTLQGGPDRARVTFTFLKPEVVRVLLKYGDDPAGEVRFWFSVLSVLAVTEGPSPSRLTLDLFCVRH